jgi:hypothetical protein
MRKQPTKKQLEESADTAWKDAIRDHVKKRYAEKIPKGWYTADQISKQIGHNKEYTSRHLSELIRAGKAERKKFSLLVNAEPPYHRRLPMFRLL